MYKYIRIMRVDHWIKQCFILPGCFLGLFFFSVDSMYADISIFHRFFIGMISASFIASSNYVINEWLDAEFDQYHPVKKHRSVVESNLNSHIVYALYFGLAILGISLAFYVGLNFFFIAIWLWIMGIIYNIRPIRSKDIPVLDVLSESVNNAIRLLLGWFIVTNDFLPPISIVLGYWFGGAFLMSIKRFAEYCMIDNPALAKKYRKSFGWYNRESLLNMSFFYAMCSIFFIGIFLIKYRLEMILFVPFLILLFSLYFHISFKNDSAVQKPEKIFYERNLMIYVVFLCILFIVLLYTDFAFVSGLANSELLRI